MDIFIDSLLDSAGTILASELKRLMATATSRHYPHKLEEIFDVLDNIPPEKSGLSFDEFSKTMQTIESKTSTYPMCLTSGSSSHVYMLPRRLLLEEVSSFNEIYLNFVPEDTKTVTREEFIDLLRNNIVSNQADESKILELLSTHLDNSPTDLTALEDLLQHFAMIGEYDITSTTMLNKKELNGLRSLFGLFDSNNDGKLEVTELNELLARAHKIHEGTSLCMQGLL